MKTLSTRQPAFAQAWARLCARGSEEDEGGVREAAAAIVAEVRERGDRALLELTARFDGWRPRDAAALEVGPAAFAAAFAGLPPAARRALRLAARRIVDFHRRERDAEVPTFTDCDGSRLGQVTRPLARVGLYAPGGTARYPSTVLMTALPARVAGVAEVFVCSPAVKGTGEVDAWTLAACHVAGVTRLFKVGGAQAVAALAYGTATVPAVDKICGPGNAYVAAAKRLVFGKVDIDMVAGPTEVVVVAGPKADPAEAASDLLAQAEHDVRAVPVLITPSPALAEAVEAELARQLATLPRREIAERALADRGALVVTRDVAEAVRLADEFAPEHLALLLPDARRWVARISRAGAVFVGDRTPEAVGDYVAGPSHVLPTAGTARFASPLSVATFRRRMSVLELSQKGLAAVAPAVDALAAAEGLEAHARAVRARLAPGKVPGKMPRPRQGVERRAGQGAPPRDAPPPGRLRQGPAWKGSRGCEGREMSWRDHLRPSLAGLGVYRPFDYAAAPAGLLRLDANEAAYPLDPEELELFQAELSRVDLRRYPEVSGRPLREALARRWGVAPEQILLGNGSDEIIDRLVTAFGAGREGVPAAVLYPAPTFGEYESIALVHGARPLPVPLDARFQLDEAALAEAIRRERPALAFFATPNNPTGNCFDAAVIAAAGAAHGRGAGGRRGLRRLRGRLAPPAGGRGAGPLRHAVALQGGLRRPAAGGAGGAARGGGRARQGAPALQRERALAGHGLGGAGASGRAAAAHRGHRGAPPRARPGARRRAGAGGLPQRRQLRAGPRRRRRAGRVGAPARPRRAGAQPVAPGPAARLPAHHRRDRRGERRVPASPARRPGLKAGAKPKSDTSAAAAPGGASAAPRARQGQVARATRETDIQLALSLAPGPASIETGVPFFDHMLDQLARHGGLSLTVKARGDLQVDAHHTVEDVGIAFGQALRQALADKVGIARYGLAVVPLDEALAEAVIDLSGRPHLTFNAALPSGKRFIGAFDVDLTQDFFQALVNHGGLCLHVNVRYGRNLHHVVEAIFKAVARALRAAVAVEGSELPSTKGLL